MSQLEKVYDAIGPTGIACKDLFAALEIPRHEVEQHLSVLLSGKRITVLNGMYVQVPKYDDYYDARGRLKRGYEGVSDPHRERADGTVVEGIPEPPPLKIRKPTKPLEDEPTERTCTKCKATLHHAYFTYRIVKSTGTRAWNQFCNHCHMLHQMERTEFGRWLLQQPETDWARLRRQRKHDLKYKRDTLGIGIAPHHHKFEPEAKADFDRAKVRKAQDDRWAKIFETVAVTAPVDLLVALQPDGPNVPEGFGENTLSAALDRPLETAQEGAGATMDPTPPPQHGGALTLTAELALYRGLIREVLHAPKGMQYLPYDLIERMKDALNYDAPSRGTAVPKATEPA